jgi:hypothetical protein
MGNIPSNDIRSGNSISTSVDKIDTNIRKGDNHSNHKNHNNTRRKYLRWVEGHKCQLNHEILRSKEFEGKKLQEITAWLIEKYKVKRLKDEVKRATLNRELALLNVYKGDGME